MSDLEALKTQFDHAMFNIYRRAKSEAGYPAKIFLQMVADRGGLAAAKALINAVKESDGYVALWERKRLDLTVEALVAEDDRWHPLFEPQEIESAWKRLKKYQYPPAMSRSGEI